MNRALFFFFSGCNYSLAAARGAFAPPLVFSPPLELLPMNLVSLSHAKGQNTFHVVIVPKYRHKAFADEDIKLFCRKVFFEACVCYGHTLLEVKILADHVHLFISVNPNVSILRAIAVLKSISARRLFKKFPARMQLKFWGRKLWSRGKFFRSVGAVTANTVEKYIRESQEKHERQIIPEQTTLTQFP